MSSHTDVRGRPVGTRATDVAGSTVSNGKKKNQKIKKIKLKQNCVVAPSIRSRAFVCLAVGRTHRRNVVPGSSLEYSLETPVDRSGKGWKEGISTRNRVWSSPPVRGGARLVRSRTLRVSFGESWTWKPDRRYYFTQEGRKLSFRRGSESVRVSRSRDSLRPTIFFFILS